MGPGYPINQRFMQRPASNVNPFLSGPLNGGLGRQNFLPGRRPAPGFRPQGQGLVGYGQPVSGFKGGMLVGGGLP